MTQKAGPDAKSCLRGDYNDFGIALALGSGSVLGIRIGRPKQAMLTNISIYLPETDSVPHLGIDRLQWV